MREQLLHWIKCKHQGQMVRGTDRPYEEHLMFVAERAGAIVSLGYEIGLYHDLLEKTNVSSEEIHTQLLAFGYTHIQALYIMGCVNELTDVFTKQAFPNIGKKERKKSEARRLSAISADAQTVKYADLIYNIHWVMLYQRHKASSYLRRKQKLVTSMEKGDPELRHELLSLIERSLKQL